MADTSAEKHPFKSELQQMLHLITHSLYSHKEIFLRELISNASDAIDKVRFNSLQNEHLVEGDRDWKIKLAADLAAGTLTVSDNGIGMTREEIIENLGTIARSGTRAFLDSLKQADAAARPELIGQFGVGFYSAFMVADQVTVVSRAAGADRGGALGVRRPGRVHRGGGVEARPGHGRDPAPEGGREGIPAALASAQHGQAVLGLHRAPHRHGRGEGRGEAGPDEETLNSRKALWLRSKGDVTAGGAQRLLPADRQRLRGSGQGDPLRRRRRAGLQGPALHPQAQELRPAVRRGQGGSQALRQPGADHGPLRAAAAGATCVS